MTAFVVIVAGCVWLLAIMWVGCVALEAGFDKPLKGVGIGLIAVMMFAAPIAIILSGDADDPHANQLCTSGRQEWVTTQRPGMLVGKIFIPGGPETHKAWFCSAWE